MQCEMGQNWGWRQEKSGGLWAASPAVPQEKVGRGGSLAQGFLLWEKLIWMGGSGTPDSSPWGSSVRISTVLKWNPWDPSQVPIMIINSRMAATEPLAPRTEPVITSPPSARGNGGLAGHTC